MVGAIAEAVLIVAVHGAPCLGAPGWSAFQKWDDELSTVSRLEAGPFGCDFAVTDQPVLFIQPDASPNCNQWIVGPLLLYDAPMVQRQVWLLQVPSLNSITAPQSFGGAWSSDFIASTASRMPSHGTDPSTPDSNRTAMALAFRAIALE